MKTILNKLMSVEAVGMDYREIAAFNVQFYEKCPGIMRTINAALSALQNPATGNILLEEHILTCKIEFLSLNQLRLVGLYKGYDCCKELKEVLRELNSVLKRLRLRAKELNIYVNEKYIDETILRTLARTERISEVD